MSSHPNFLGLVCITASDRVRFRTITRKRLLQLTPIEQEKVLENIYFDAHHHIVHEQLDSYEDPSVAEMLKAARSTWKVPEWQLVHISNGNSSFRDREHSDYITIMPSSYRDVRWIEVEAKQKEKAIELLRQSWLLE